MDENHLKQFRIPLFCFVTILFWASLFTYVPVFTSYVEGLGASHKMAGMIVGFYGFAQLILRIPLGIASDRIHKRRLFISIGMLISLISAVGLLLFKNLHIILISRMLAGASAASWVEFTILFASYYQHHETTKAIGIMNFCSIIGITSGMLAGSFTAESYGWYMPFVIAIGISSVGFMLTFFLKEKFEEGGEKLSFEKLKDVISDRLLITVSVLAVLLQMLIFATGYGFTPIYAEQYLHATQSQMGILTVLSAIPMAVASLLPNVTFFRKMGEQKLIVTGLIVASTFTALIPAVGGFWFLVLTQFVAGLGKGLAFTLLMSLSIKYMSSGKRATAMGFFQAIYGLGMFGGPVLMGMIGDSFGILKGFIALGCLGVLSSVYAKFALERSQKKCVLAEADL